MAVLGPRADQSPRERSARALAVVALLSLVGCLIADHVVVQEDTGPAFSHVLHVQDQGLDCAVCHKEELGRDRPTLPKPDLCLLCHRRLDVEKEPEERIASIYFPDGEFVPSMVSTVSPEIIFSHASHLEYVEDCTVCHTGIPDSTRITDVPRLTMNQCMDCHAQNDVSRDCGTCHRELDVDVLPENHEHLWMELHGSVFRNRSDAVLDDCSLCHTETSCVACHQDEQPADHTNFFRLRSHGLAASFDRRRCQVCHRDDFCNRCHQEATPLSHKGMWGQPKDTHCLSCHFPLQNESCFVCHKGTPSHGQATPLPPDHNPASNCRQCHGNGAPLPHVDDGSSCTLCHK